MINEINLTLSRTHIKLNKQVYIFIKKDVNTEYETYILNKLGEKGKYKNSFRPDESSIQIFVEGNTITADLETGEVEQEKLRLKDEEKVFQGEK